MNKLKDKISIMTEHQVENSEMWIPFTDEEQAEINSIITCILEQKDLSVEASPSIVTVDSLFQVTELDGAETNKADKHEPCLSDISEPPENSNGTCYMWCQTTAGVGPVKLQAVFFTSYRKKLNKEPNICFDIR